MYLYGLICLAVLVWRTVCVPTLTPLEAISLTIVNDLQTRETPSVPDVNEIKKHLDVAQDICLFYSGPGGYAKKARDWAKSKKNGYKVLAQLWKDRSYPDPWQKDESTYKSFFDKDSQAMAELSSGTVIMLPSDTKGKNWEPNTVWANYKRPNLGSAVTKVIRINPDNDDQETIKDDSSATFAKLPPPASCQPTSGPISAGRDYVHDTIVNRYCKYMATGTINANSALDDEANQGVTTSGAITIDQTQPYGPVGYNAGPDGSPESANTLWLSISLVHDPGCMAGFKVNKATCEIMLGVALDGCNTGATDKKYSGSTQYECGIYDIQLKSGHDDTPPRGFAAEHGG